MGDHLGSIHFLFQFSYDWQKYKANLPNFTAHLEFRKKSIIYKLTEIAFDSMSLFGAKPT